MTSEKKWYTARLRAMQFLVETSNRGLRPAVQFRHRSLWYKFLRLSGRRPIRRMI